MIEWKTETRKISELKPAEYNPRKANEKQFQDLKNSLTKFSLADPIVINRDGTVIGGHLRLRVLGDGNGATVDVRVPSRQLTVDEERELNIRLNHNSGEWDWEKLADFNQHFLLDLGFDAKEIVENIFKRDEKLRGSMASLFTAPPFSILDSTQGYWLERKREWKEMGIEKESGRESYLLGKTLLSNFYSNGTSIFDPVLAEIIYKWFCVDNGKILDPFAGGSCRGLVAGHLGYQYTGIDLSKKQVETNEKNMDFFKGKITKKPVWILGNSKNEIPELEEFYDLIFSCPPYFNMEIYSRDPDDLSNQKDYTGFIKLYDEIISKSCEKLKHNRFACFVVGQVRNKKGFYYDLIGDTIREFERKELKLYNQMVLKTSFVGARLCINRFRGNRKIINTHQNILVFFKGNPEKIKIEFKRIKNHLTVNERDDISTGLSSDNR